MAEKIFQSSFGAQLDLNEVIGEIFNFIKIAPNRQYKVVIGTDSLNGPKTANFVTAVIVLRIGNGGRYFWNEATEKTFKTLRDRIYKEMYLSLETAQNLLELLEKKKLPQFDLEIHVDVGQNGDTKTLINEVVGVIRGSGFVVKTKPESFGASSVADHRLWILKHA